MNKVININLAGRLIAIDETAYHQLESYLKRLKAFFLKEEGGDEILHDMEDRIGELFQDKLKKGSACIMTEDINEMIAIMGSPEQIENESGEIDKEDKNNSGPFQQPETTAKRTLYRSKKDKVIGGVCGGIAAYLKIDPVILRIAAIFIALAWGTGILLSILLWIIVPEKEEQYSELKRRLYRNPRQKVIGGVCSGIAAYVNIDPIIPRLVFVAPLLGVILFGALNNDFFLFPISVGSFPTMVLLYIILWASVPAANTVAEKLEMRGGKVDVQSLSQAIKSPGIHAAQPETGKSGFASVLSFLFKAFVFFVLGMVIIIIAGVLTGLVMALIGLAIPSAFMLPPYSQLITDSPVQTWGLLICAVLVLLIPFLMLIRLLIRTLSGRRYKKSNKWVMGIQSFLFIIGIFGLFWITSSILTDFRTAYPKRYEFPLQAPLNDTLIIKKELISSDDDIEDMWEDGDISDGYNGLFMNSDSGLSISNIRLDIIPSPDSSYHLILQKKARGRNQKVARERAEQIPFSFRKENNTLFLPGSFELPANAPFRGQKLRVKVQVPEGKVFRTEYAIHDQINSFYWRKGIVRHRTGYRAINNSRWSSSGYYYMTKDGPVALEKNIED